MFSRVNRLEIALFVVLFLSFAYFYQGGGANQNARLGQTRAIVEKGQLHFSGMRVPTHDTVTVDGKVYPNKAPGMSLLGVGPYFLVSLLRGTLTGLFSEDFYHLFSCWLVTLLIVALPCALGGVVFFRLLGLFHPSIAPRVICTLALFLGTPAFAYSTVVYSHMIGSVLTVVSFYLLLKYLVLEPAAPRATLFIFLSGLAGGWAVVSEYPVAAIVTILTLYCLVRGFVRNGVRGFRSLYFLAGLVLPAAVLLTYNHLVFDNPFYIAYFDHSAAAHRAYGEGPILGFRTRQMIEALYQTSFGPFRGFFHLSPFLILLFPGGYFLAREKGFRSLLPILAVMVSGYFFLNAIYPYWYGGKALGPRHAMEVLPYMALLAFFFVVKFPRISALLAAVSIFLILTAVSVRFEEYARHPFRDLYFYSFFGGYLMINPETTFQVNSVVSSSFNAFNLGQVAGLQGQASLLPLYLVWMIGGATMIHYGKKTGDERRGEPVPGVSSGLIRAVLVLLAVVLVLGVYNLIGQLQLKSALREMDGAGAYRVSAARAPEPHIQLRTTPGHRLQVWEVLKPYSPGDQVTVKVQHAASGSEGGFFIVAYGDLAGDGRPDRELERSSFLTARSAGDWSFWTVTAPEGRLFVGNTWNEGGRVFFDRTGWSHRDLSPTMHYSSAGPPSLSTGPRSTNLTVEINPPAEGPAQEPGDD